MPTLPGHLGSWGRQKPPSGVQVNWGHPLAKGLRGCWPLNEGGGIPVSPVNGSTIAGVSGLWSPSRAGSGLNVGDAQRAYAFTNQPYRPGSSPNGVPFSWLTVGMFSSFVNYRTLVSDLGLFNYSYELLVDSTGQFTFLKRAVALCDSGFTVAVAQPFSTVWTIGLDNKVGFAVNGHWALHSNTSTLSDAGDINYFGLGRNLQSAGCDYLTFVAVWDRRFTAEEALTLSIDPFCFLVAP